MPANTETNLKNTDSHNLTQEQMRLINSVNAMITHAMTTLDESDYFETSSELLRLVATAVKRADFVKANEGSLIPYDKQALEFCVDILSDQVYADDVVKYDN